MTEDPRRQDIKDEVRRGNESVRAAEALVAAQLFGDAASRAYYGAWHHLRALLLARETEARTHAGATHLFNTEFVRKGFMEASRNRLLGGLQRARELAAYDAGVAFTAQDAAALLNDARTFQTAARTLLIAEGWLPADDPQP